MGLKPKTLLKTGILLYQLLGWFITGHLNLSMKSLDWPLQILRVHQEWHQYQAEDSGWPWQLLRDLWTFKIEFLLKIQSNHIASKFKCVLFNSHHLSQFHLLMPPFIFLFSLPLSYPLVHSLILPLFYFLILSPTLSSSCSLSHSLSHSLTLSFTLSLSHSSTLSFPLPFSYPLVHSFILQGSIS